MGINDMQSVLSNSELQSVLSNSERGLEDLQQQLVLQRSRERQAAMLLRQLPLYAATGDNLIQEHCNLPGAGRLGDSEHGRAEIQNQMSAVSQLTSNRYSTAVGGRRRIASAAAR